MTNFWFILSAISVLEQVTLLFRLVMTVNNISHDQFHFLILGDSKLLSRVEDRVPTCVMRSFFILAKMAALKLHVLFVYGMFFFSLLLSWVTRLLLSCGDHCYKFILLVCLIKAIWSKRYNILQVAVKVESENIDLQVQKILSLSLYLACNLYIYCKHRFSLHYQVPVLLRSAFDANWPCATT